MSGSPAILFFHRGHSDLAIDLDRPPRESLLATREVLGGKGASLHLLAALGFRVPAGFTIPVAWCAAYHAAGGVLPVELRNQVALATGHLEELTGKDLSSRAGGLKVAVRSGAAESMPGMMDTVLDVNSLPAIEAAIERVLRSWMSERAVAYRRERGIVGLGGTAVTVQEMCPAEVAGVAFTIDPETGGETVLVEAVRGFGEGLVSGAKTPDRARFLRPSLEVGTIDRRSSEPVLAPDLAREVARLALEVEERFGCPIDLEWAMAGGEIHLLQARQVHGPGGIDVRRSVLLREVDRLVSKRPDSRHEAAFARHNLDETLSHPTPLTWDIHRQFFRGKDGFLGLYLDLGFRPSKRVIVDGFLAKIGGRIYAECGRAAELFHGCDLLRHNVEAIRRDPALLDQAPRLWNVRAATPGKILRVLWHGLLSERRIGRLRGTFASRFAREVLPEWSVWCRDRSGRNLAALGPVELMAELDRRVERVFGSFPREALKLSFLAGLAHSELVDFLERHLGEVEGRRTARVLLAAPGMEDAAADQPAQQTLAVASLIRGELALEDFLEAFGHRGPGEMDLARPRWREDPRALSALIDPVGSGITRGLEERALEDPRRAEEAVLAALEPSGPAAVKLFRERLEEVRQLLPWRERWKHHWMFGLDLVRRVILEIDSRMGLEGQAFYLEREELREVVANGGRPGAGHLETIRRRREEERMARSLDLPDLVTIEQLERIAAREPMAPETLPAPAAARLEGTPISSGVGDGRAWVSTSPDSPPVSFPYVLVCPTTDPGWTPLLARARALIVERGGALSHGAIVCRDFGVPAVVVADATRRLKHGERLRVDGTRGIVERREIVERRDGSGQDQPPGVSLEPEPWVAPARPRLGRRIAVGIAAAIALSALLVGVPPFGNAILTIAAPAFEWTLAPGISPFFAIASAAMIGALASTLIALAILDRRRLRAMRVRLAWYGRELRKLKPPRRGSIPAGTPAKLHRAAARETLERRRRQASLERSLELLRPVAWSFLPFCIAWLWVEAHFAFEPIRPGTIFEVKAFFQPRPENAYLRFARLDIEGQGGARLLDPPYQRLEPNQETPGLGLYRATWSLEALEESEARFAITAREARREAEVLVTHRREFASSDLSPGDVMDGAREITAVRVAHPPLLVELPEPVFHVLCGFTRWVTGGREITRRQAAFGPMSTFLVLAILFTLLLQRSTGIR